ncbi:MAG: hypothetical protein ACI4PH_01270 [Faecousia sp.]
MTNEEIRSILYQEGRRQALDLQERAADMTGTELIAEEQKVPAFDPDKDYSSWPVGAPVADQGQVWTLLQPHNAANYQGRPSTLRALWGLAHTTDPERAKPWVDPYGISGMYMAGECYTGAEGTVYRCKADNTVYDAAAMPDAWEAVG